MTFKPYSTGVEISRAKHVMVYAPQICTKAFMIIKKNVHIGLAFRNKHNGKTFFKNHPKIRDWLPATTYLKCNESGLLNL
jgi:hypothetical protein